MTNINAFIFLAMIFCHIIDDYCLQPICLSSLKQKSTWRNDPLYSDKYKYDYIAALAAHAFGWSFMVMLPIVVVKDFNFTISYYAFFWANAIVHGVIDHLKANEFILNLIQDQLIHVAQIIVTAAILL